jgi:hypothetical protein
MFSAYSFAQWGRPANCLFPMRRQLSRHSEEAGWKPRERHFPKYTRKDMKVTGADPTRTCFAATLTDWRTPKGNGCKPLIVLLECGPRARVAEWQTQWTQNPPRAISCGFNSRPGHQRLWLKPELRVPLDRTGWVGYISADFRRRRSRVVGH